MPYRCVRYVGAYAISAKTKRDIFGACYFSVIYALYSVNQLDYWDNKESYTDRKSLATPLHDMLFVLMWCKGLNLFSRLPIKIVGSYRVDWSEISASGMSSGGGMTTQMHVAYSSVFMGVGIISGSKHAQSWLLWLAGCGWLQADIWYISCE